MSKNKNITDFLSLIQDEAFINQVNKTENPNELLEELVERNAGNSDSIRYAFEFIQVNLSNRTEMGSEDFDQILKNIQNHFKRKTYLPYLNFIPQLRIAAIILVIISIGSLVIYHHFAKDPLSQFAQSNATDSNQATIVLSDGSTRVLKNNDSFIDYNSTDGEVLIKSDYEQKKIENKNNIKDAVFNQVVVPCGQRKKVWLSDGTLVYLNAGSSLTFPATFYGKTREVYLKGEGFFEVSRNEKVPFIVKTNHIDVKVIGTTFNVSAYNDECIVSAVLVEGKVEVSQKNQILANDEFTLAQGQGLFYSVNSKNSVVNEVDVDDFVLWKDGLFKFHDMPLVDIVRRVQKYYSLPIQIDGEKLANILVSGKLVLSEDFCEVMKYLSKTIEGSYEKTHDGIYILKQ
ncbi:MAG: FecR domain-containing protein [Lentimicrobiaceae bacterium]|nr:FecR domain-containing protein [Lentimicrobiaceae bacterium]